MHKSFEPLISALDSVASAIIAISPGQLEGLNTLHGWNQVGISLTDLARLASDFAAQIRDRGADELSSEDSDAIQKMAVSLEYLRTNSVAQMWGGNGVTAVPAYILTLEAMRTRLRPLMPEVVTIDSKTLPVQLARRILRLNAELDKVIVDRDELSARMTAINEAYEAAGHLPEDLASLREARDEVVKLSGEATKSVTQISLQESTASASLESITTFQVEAEKLVAQCEEAYRVTTSKGLAGAFDQRATGLSRSMQLWVAALVIALGVAAYLGGQRVELLSKNLGEADLKWGVIWLNLVLSLLSVGAPLWFAWVATKQIGQRFRLSEDYGYKASIAKAYEGYRREAAKLDPDFAARLFGSSLNRLEEAPLRLMDTTSHGSPMHEFFANAKVQEAWASIPSFREKLLDLFTQAKDGKNAFAAGKQKPTEPD
jgi:hypothetical protein